MPSPNHPLASAIGAATRRLREERGWTQRDLAVELKRHDDTWTAKRVGVLESSGVRADRFSTILQLCDVFGVGPGALFDSGTVVAVGDHQRDHTWITERLALPTSAEDPPVPSVRLGVDDGDETRKIAERAHMSVADVYKWASQHFDGSTPMEVRDALAGVTPETPPREAQAKRGHGSRRLVALIAFGDVDPTASELVRNRRKQWATAGPKSPYPELIPATPQSSEWTG